MTLCCPCCPSCSLHLAALAAPNPPCSSPGPTPTPITFVAPAGCSPGSKRPLGPACGLPAGCLPPQRCCWSAASLCTAGGPMCSGPAAAAASLLGLRSVQHALGGRVGSMPHQGDGRWRAVCQALWQCRATASVKPRTHVWVELVGRACGMKPARPPSRVHPCYPGGTLAPLILTTRRF